MTYEEFAEKFNIRLNQQQSCAVRVTEGAVLLLAVPGSGKTTVLVSRLGYMLYCKDISPSSILTMTYTIAATNDMRRRYATIFGNEFASSLEFRTINGVCSKIIRTYEQMSGSHAFELLVNEKEISALIASIYRETEDSFPSESDIKSVRTLITYAKNMMLSESEIKNLDDELSGFSDMYRRYCDALKSRRLMDYDDQMVYALRIIERYPQILQKIHSRYRYICVDEAQDTSKIQHKIISLLAKGSGNIFMVGDEDQSIYGFRAAYPQALMDFEKEYKNAKILLMEENFRSGAKIVGAADSFVSKNTNRHKKNMRAARQDSDNIKNIALTTRMEQYSYLLNMARKCGRDTAVLYRDNESALPLIDLFDRNGITFRMRSGDMTFFSHRIVADIKNIIRFAYDPSDTDAFMQIYYKVTTYLNKANASVLCEISRKENISVWDSFFAAENIQPGVLRGCRSIKSHFDALPKERGDRAISRIFNVMGYSEYLERMGMKTEKISVLAAVGANEVSPLGLLRRLDELESLVRSDTPVSEPLITLSTIHSSKGLEYDTVYIMDVYDGLFPETVADDPRFYDEESMRTYQEERRLFYVGVTRAKNNLRLLTYKDSPSSFSEEFLSAYSTAVIEGKCKVGDRLIHKVYGEGTVLSLHGDIVKIDFADGNVRAFSLKTLFSQNLLKR